MNTEIKRKALVAEDDRALADIIRCALARAGLDVTVAHDGQKALGLARRNTFDVIVSDYQMPKMDGEQFLREVRNGSASCSAQFYLCSAKAFELESERLFQELGISEIFYKPFSLSELTRAVCRAVDGSNPRPGSTTDLGSVTPALTQ